MKPRATTLRKINKIDKPVAKQIGRNKKTTGLSGMREVTSLHSLQKLKV